MMQADFEEVEGEMQDHAHQERLVQTSFLESEDRNAMPMQDHGFGPMRGSLAKPTLRTTAPCSAIRGRR